ncbi:uncharacterized protein SCHCODRAFT_02492717 [Schizophyllum commune H4-8]|uniref:uncharacterized protein n=1 Tax=Schizophyllum commune (strain H4-8 / FGSC 9210) TaxID=578458 RepID=UPI002160FBDC|nr:uncharacterized protein SCHCODRAFT_02492717 [Schizophyllum commune H4-8]KAI5896083.1 hypothetical protein SCHCODRAFT_02492717 [Schizophyllum commune H4-8]
MHHLYIPARGLLRVTNTRRRADEEGLMRIGDLDAVVHKSQAYGHFGVIPIRCSYVSVIIASIVIIPVLSLSYYSLLLLASSSSERPERQGCPPAYAGVVARAAQW